MSTFKFTPNLIEIREYEKKLFENPELKNTRQPSFTDAEWLGYIYYLKIGFSSVIRSRRAPLEIEEKYLSKMTGKTVLPKEVFENLLKDSKEYRKKELQSFIR